MENSGYSEIKKLRSLNLRFLFIISDMLSYVNDEKELMYLIEKIEKIKSME